jgi:hypothetical protein
MPRFWIAVFLLAFIYGCGGNKVSLSGDAPVASKDFFAAFTTITIPFVVADSNNHTIEDTTVIAYNVLSQFIPDSAVEKIIGKNKDHYQIKPVGKIEKENEIYLLVNFDHNKKTILVTFLFDKKFRFLAALELFSNGKDDGYKHSVSINNEPTFLLTREKTNSDNHYYYTKNGYAYNKDVNGFILVVNDSNEDPVRQNEIVNPIDTLPHKNKFSGDYAQDKKDFISIRDGKNANDYIFFIHFEKDEGACNGELKGEMTTVSKNKTVYRENGDPCIIDFTFDESSVYVKEEGSCGNHRGIKCYFDDSYEKKKLKRNEKKSNSE